MATKKRKSTKRPDRSALDGVAGQLDKFMSALGLSVILLQQTQQALRKDAVALRVNADQFCESVGRLPRMSRALRAELRKAGRE